MRIELFEHADTTRVAQLIATLLRPGDTVCFEGPLGAGKTSLISEIVRALGGTEPVSSPTYVLQHEYRTPSGVVEHWDLYRIASLPEELFEPTTSSMRLIEWGNKFSDFFAHAELHIVIDYRPGESPERQLTISGPGLNRR